MSRFDPVPPTDHLPLTEALPALLGEEAAQKLCDAFGGRRLHVPRAPGRAHPITVVVGQAAADKLAGAYHGFAIDVPMMGARRRRIVELDAAGWSRSKIARAVHVGERRVYQVLAEERDRKPSPQGRLFD